MFTRLKVQLGISGIKALGEKLRYSGHSSTNRGACRTRGRGVERCPLFTGVFAFLLKQPILSHHNTVSSSTETVRFSDPFAKHRIIFPNIYLFSWKCLCLNSDWSYIIGSKSKVLSAVWNNFRNDFIKKVVHSCMYFATPNEKKWIKFDNWLGQRSHVGLVTLLDLN